MADPTPGTPPSPWNPRPLAPIPPRAGRGCSKPALIGCGALLVLLGVLAIVFVLNVSKFLRWTFGRLEAQIVSQLPPDLPAAERQRLLAAFAAVDRATESGKLDPIGLQQIQAKLVQLSSQPNRQLTREDVRELTLALERLAGKAAVTPAPTPVPASPSTASPAETPAETPPAHPVAESRPRGRLAVA